MRRRQSLLSKIIVGVSLAVLAIEGVVLVPIILMYRNELVGARRESTEVLARALASGPRDERQLAEANAALYDRDMALVAGRPDTERATVVDALSAALARGAAATLERDGRLVIGVPLRGPQGDVRGFLVRSEPLEPITGRLASRVLLAMGLVMVVLLFTGITVIGAIYRHILRPIGALTAANRALVEGDERNALVPDAAIPNDELGDAIRSRNEIYRQMLEYQRSIREKNEILQRQGVELKRWTAELERRVREKSEDLVRAHDRLLESEKLAATGRLAAGVAHEINNPLASIAGYAEDLLGLAKDPRLAGLAAFKDFPESLAVIEEQAFRCKKIIKQLLSFARPAEFAVEPLDLGQLVEDVLPLVEYKTRGRDIAIVMDEQPGTPNAQGDKTHLMQVLVNLIENAFDAIQGPEGQITIVTRRATPRSAGGLGVVAIEVRDTGIGIREADRKKIFDPFFTTKPVGKGTGLGLSICHSLVSRMGGRIEVASEVGRGSTFTVYLPATAELATIEAV
jgi:signal transduction histidine kinase